MGLIDWLDCGEFAFLSPYFLLDFFQSGLILLDLIFQIGQVIRRAAALSTDKIGKARLPHMAAKFVLQNAVRGNVLWPALPVQRSLGLPLLGVADLLDSLLNRPHQRLVFAPF